MTEIQRLVDDIRAMLRSLDRLRSGDAASSSQGQLPPLGSAVYDDLARLATGYAAACTAANRRLKHCERLLNQGLITEAMQAAEADPALLPVARVLEFEEREDWTRLVQDLGLAPAEPLFVETVEALDQAFDESRPLVGLLREHRRLALGRASLTRRIEVLQRLAIVDHLNTNWEQDLRAYQKVRLAQIGDEAADADRRADADALDRLAHELDETDWREPVPPDRASKLRSRASRLRREATYRTLPELADRLLAAQASDDSRAGLEARHAWNDAVAAARPKDDDPVSARARPALDWLATLDGVAIDEENRRRVREELERALKGGKAGAAELRALASRARGFGPLPEELRKPLDARLLALEARRRRGRRVIIGSVAGATMVAAAIVAWQSRQADFQRRVADARASVSALLDAMQLDAARTYLENLASNDPPVAADPLIVGLRNRWVEAAANETVRREQFEQAMQNALDDDLLAEVSPGLEKARRLSQTAEERVRVSDLDKQRADERKKKLEERDKDQGAKIAGLQGDVRMLRDDLGEPGDAGKLIRRADNLAESLKEIEAELPEGSRHREAVAALGLKIGECRKDAARRRDAERREAEITRAVAPGRLGPDPSNADAYVAAIKALIESDPDSPRAAGLRQGLEGEEATWRDALAWADRLRAWKSAGVDLSRSAPEIGKAVGTYLAAHPKGASAAVADRLGAAAAAVAKRPGIVRELRDLFNRPYMKYYQVSVAGVGFYYMTTNPKIDRTSLVEMRLRVALGADETDIRVKPTEVGQTRASPQFQIATNARRDLEAAGVGWEEKMLRILRLVHGDGEVDRVLHGLMLAELSRKAGEGSVPLADALKEPLARLARIRGVFDWKNPRDAGATSERDEAGQITARIDIDAIRKAFEANQKRLGSILSRELLPVGWLVEEGPGKWTCRLGAVPVQLRDADLWAVDPPRPGASAAWTKIGSLSDGEIAGGLDLDARAVEGRPVFAGGPPGFDD